MSETPKTPDPDRPQATPNPDPSGTESAGQTPPNADPQTNPATFLQFLSGMGMQTLMHLGLMSNPMTNERGVDLAQAKYSIDILAMLEDKTRGNRTGEEEEYLQSMLAQLRMGYVDAVARRDGGEGDAGEPRDETPDGGASGASSSSGDGDDAASGDGA